MATASRLQKQPAPAGAITINPVPLTSSVEIFANQLPFKIQQGKSKTIALTGSVYNNTPFVGTITVEPNSPIGSTTNVACPILAGPVSKRVSLPAGANEVIVNVTFTCPANTPRGSYNCALRYRAVLDNGTNVAKSNEVDIGYNVIPPR
jgi:hypothetical protein